MLMRALLCLFAATALFAVEPDRAPLRMAHPLQDKNFQLLTLLDEYPAARAIRMDKPPAAKWTAEQVSAVENELRALYRKDASLRDLVDNRLRRSGAMQLHAGQSGEDLLATAWRETTAGMNRLMDVYALGTPPRYAAIDSISHDAKSPEYSRLLALAERIARQEARPGEPFYASSLRYALMLLDINRRDEAVRYEPLEQGENRAAYLRVPDTRFADYPYSAIVVPGAGSDQPEVRLSAFGRLRARIAANSYHSRQAPFVIVSGGHVHPNQTPYAEAIEMKRVLIADYGVPEHAILVDPHARHTTTNVRNAARLLYRYGFPFDKPALIATDPGQSTYIENPNFAKRCRDELGYLPYRDLRRTSPFDLEFLPTIESLQFDPNDPLDP